MVSSRRKFILAGLGVGVGSATAGCSSRTDETPTRTETPEELYNISGSLTISPGEFRDFAIDLDDIAEIDYTVDVRSGPNIDVLVLPRGEFREYERGNEFGMIASASALDTSYADVRADLDSTDINLVLDNTDAGTALPTDRDAVINFQISATARTE